MKIITLNPQYIKDGKGNKIFVVLPFKDFKTMIKGFEELDNVLVYDEAKQSKETSIPIDEAFKMIETKRKK